MDFPTKPSSLYSMNQNLLMSYASSSRSSDTLSRPASPLSDPEDDVQQANLPAAKDDYFDDYLSTTATLPTTSFHHPDPTCPNYMVLQTNFDINASENKKIPYPRPDAERRIWTDEQRALASQAMISDDSADFALKVCTS